jgi:hypothetical protein
VALQRYRYRRAIARTVLAASRNCLATWRTEALSHANPTASGNRVLKDRAKAERWAERQRKSDVVKKAALEPFVRDGYAGSNVSRGRSVGNLSCFESSFAARTRADVSGMHEEKKEEQKARFMKSGLPVFG